MSQNERNSVISLIVSISVTAPYLFHVFSRYQSGAFSPTEELRFWAIAILILIPIRIIAEIIMNINIERIYWRIGRNFFTIILLPKRSLNGKGYF